MKESPARLRLKEATAAGEKTVRQVRALEESLASASRIVEDALRELATFDDLPAKISKFRVRAVKTGVNPKALPDDLKAAVSAKRNAEEELEQATATRDLVQEELEQARRELAPMDNERRKAALDVLREVADSVAAEIAQFNSRQRDVLQVIGGLANLSFMIDGRIQYVGYTDTMKSAAAMPQMPFPSMIDPLADIGKRWMGRLDRLLEDPDADVTFPKPVHPSDYIHERVDDDRPGYTPRIKTTLRPEA